MLWYGGMHLLCCGGAQMLSCGRITPMESGRWRRPLACSAVTFVPRWGVSPSCPSLGLNLPDAPLLWVVALGCHQALGCLAQCVWTCILFSFPLSIRARMMVKRKKNTGKSNVYQFTHGTKPKESFFQFFFGNPNDDDFFWVWVRSRKIQKCDLPPK